MNIDVKKVKIIVAVPTESTKIVMDAVCNAGAGTLPESNYTYFVLLVLNQ